MALVLLLKTMYMYNLHIIVVTSVLLQPCINLYLLKYVCTNSFVRMYVHAFAIIVYVCSDKNILDS